MQITILSLFPQVILPFLDHSIIKRAKQKKLVCFDLLNWRDFATDKHKSVDDHPYGGGAGMLLRLEPLVKAIRFAEQKFGPAHKILLSPQGELFNQTKAKQLAGKKVKQLLLICGHYEGFDERVLNYIDEQISIGNFVLSGGESAAMVIVDSLVRLLPGVLKKESATLEETFMQIDKNKLFELTGDKTVLEKPEEKISLLEYPQYTKPEVFENQKVPAVLLSGNHAEIQKWRLLQAWKKTKKRKA